MSVQAAYNPQTLVIYQDEALLVINKPAGLPTLPDGYNPNAPHVASLVEPLYGKLWMVHRLDKETSGVLLLARNAEAHRSLNTQFEARDIHKIYHALVLGRPDWDELRVALPLRPDGDRRHRTVIDPRHGKPAVTNLRVLERFRDYSLIEAHPETGRTHQIRAHLAHEGYPIVADALYGKPGAIYLEKIRADYHRPATRAQRRREEQERDMQTLLQPNKQAESEMPLLARLALHAWSLNIEHPVSGEPVTFEALYPPDFASAVRALKKFGK